MPIRRRHRRHRAQEPEAPEPVFDLVDLIAEAEVLLQQQDAPPVEAEHVPPQPDFRDRETANEAAIGISDDAIVSAASDSLHLHTASAANAETLVDSKLEETFADNNAEMTDSSHLLNTVDLIERRMNRRQCRGGHPLQGWSPPGPGDSCCANVLLLLIMMLMCLLSPLYYLWSCWQARRTTLLHGESIDKEVTDDLKTPPKESM